MHSRVPVSSFAVMVGRALSAEEHATRPHKHLEMAAKSSHKANLSKLHHTVAPSTDFVGPLLANGEQLKTQTPTLPEQWRSYLPRAEKVPGKLAKPCKGGIARARQIFRQTYRLNLLLVQDLLYTLRCISPIAFSDCAVVALTVRGKKTLGDAATLR